MQSESELQAELSELKRKKAKGMNIPGGRIKELERLLNPDATQEEKPEQEEQEEGATEEEETEGL